MIFAILAAASLIFLLLRWFGFIGRKCPQCGTRGCWKKYAYNHPTIYEECGRCMFRYNPWLSWKDNARFVDKNWNPLTGERR